jgi:drug/metabolite transporter (DMT)-like permease
MVLVLVLVLVKSKHQRKSNRMELWIIATLFAAFFQTMRFMLQKVLASATLSTAGATFARFAYAAPAVVLLAASYVWFANGSVPDISVVFWPYALWGGTSQILATACVVKLFASRNFAVGITFKKTEVIQTALVAFIVLGESVSVVGWVAIFVGLLGVLLLSGPTAPQGGRWAFLGNHTVALGLLSGLLFSFSAVGYRGATLAIQTDDAVLRAVTALAIVTVAQALGMGLWLALRDFAQVVLVWKARATAVWMGLASMLGSLSWFIAFTLQNVAYVQALGQVELVFSITASMLFFKESITVRELTGIVVLASSIVLLLLAT